MKKAKNISGAEELNKFLTEHFDSLEHTDAPFCLKYPFLDWHIEIPVTEKRYKNITKSVKIVRNVKVIEQAMNLLLGNYEEFQHVLSNPPSPWKGTTQDLDLYKNLVARKLSNLLSSSYAYTEHTRQSLHAIKFNPSFGELKSNYITDDYLILEEVRNYAQHVGLPVHRIKFDNNLIDLFIDVEVLKTSKTKNNLLENHTGEEVNVTQILPGYITQLWALHHEIMSKLQTRIASSFDAIESAINEMQNVSQNQKLRHCILVKKTTQDKIPFALIETFITMNYVDILNLYIHENGDLYKNNVCPKPLL